MAVLPSGTISFLFTDLEQSTRLWQDHPASMEAALARHDAILREAVESHRGVVIKTTGDGILAAFGAAHDAVDAAISAQIALGDETWGPPGPLRVRMGVHAGPAELRDGDYHGTTVNRAARLMSVAHGGQILVSLATEELLQDHDVELIDLGHYSLRDLSRPERVFQVAHPGLGREFPDLTAVGAARGNLPAQVTSFVGRDDEVAQVLAMVEATPLVTLVGTGGVGKTRLAVQVAAVVQSRFPDGAWFCDLSSARDGDGMAQVIATALGCTQHEGLSLAASVVEYLKVREAIVVIDNCEHLIDDVAAFVDDLVDASPKVAVLATSREALDIAGERVVRVRSLGTPGREARGDVLRRSAAVQLFVDRARDAGVAGGWSDVQWNAVGEICRRVDGIPLAIELAAARLTTMGPNEIALLLDERFRLLTGTRRGRVERHQTLRATVEWSYQLLEPREQRVFDQLGVFAGTFDLTAASAVAGGLDVDDWAVVETIASLVAKSMVVLEDGPGDGTRYGLLETLRQFARERLDESGDTDETRRRHAEHFVRFTAQAGAGLRGADEVAWIALLVVELDNIRAAVMWALDRDDPAERELAVRILAPFPYSTTSETPITAMSALAAGAARECAPRLRAPVLAFAAYHEMFQGHPDVARALAEEALGDGVDPSSPNPLLPLEVMALIEMAAGNIGRSVELHDQARAAFGRVDDAWAKVDHLAGMTVFVAMAGDIDRAKVDAELALQMARDLRNPTVLANAYQAKAWALFRDDPEAALDAAERYIDIRRRGLGWGGASVSLISMAGYLRLRLGDPSGAFEHLRNAVAISRDSGGRLQLSLALAWSLSPLVRMGRYESAATLLGVLNGGALADVHRFPLVGGTTTKTLDRLRAALGDARSDQLAAQGAAMTYDEIVAYALQQLEPS